MAKNAIAERIIVPSQPDMQCLAAAVHFLALTFTAAIDVIQREKLKAILATAGTAPSIHLQAIFAQRPPPHTCSCKHCVSQFWVRPAISGQLARVASFAAAFDKRAARRLADTTSRCFGGQGFMAASFMSMNTLITGVTQIMGMVRLQFLAGNAGT